MAGFFKHYQYNVTAGPWYKPTSELPAEAPADPAVRVIAYYLPQFHRSAHNDAWWGPGFTEWTNVTKAVPRYAGHYQPRLPADLGFYNASQKETLQRQATLAKRGGIYGFCIHDYWFSGEKLLEKPLQTLLDNPDIDLPFCLNWANESWSRRWDGSEADVLMQQQYLPGDAERYVDSIASAIRDPRYIRIEGRPLLLIYRPTVIPDLAGSVAVWRKRFRELNLGDPFLVMPQVFGQTDPRPLGFDGAAGFPPHGGWDIADHRRHLRLFDREFLGSARSYDALARQFERQAQVDYLRFPGCCPMWDNEARKPGRGQGFYGSTPARYGQWLDHAARQALAEPQSDRRMVFIDAWNEWAEGAYLEPDRHFGAAYLIETRRVVDGLSSIARPAPMRSGADWFDIRKSKVSYAINTADRAWRRLRDR